MINDLANILFRKPTQKVDFTNLRLGINGQNIKKNVYNPLFKSHLEYGLPCWGGVKHSKLKAINILQKKSIRNIAGKHFREHTNPIYKSLGFLKVHDLVEYQSSCFMYKYFNNNPANILPLYYCRISTFTAENSAKS